MSLAILVLIGILGLGGFVLWFAFPVEWVSGLSYLKTSDLILYYVILNTAMIISMVYVFRLLYFQRVRTTYPIVDGLVLGCYGVMLSWLIDIVVYVYVRETLPSIWEYFLGKNQPEIGISWLVGVAAAILTGLLEEQRRRLPVKRFRIRVITLVSLLIVISTLLTCIGILFFDIRP